MRIKYNLEASLPPSLPPPRPSVMHAFVPDDDDPYHRVRAQFPFLALPRSSSPVFMENAGGTQCPAVVIDAIADYMRYSYFQLGAGYSLSARAESVFAAAHDFVKVFVNSGEDGDVAFGASASQLLAILASCYGRVVQKGDEVIVHEANHEANAAPWVRLAETAGLSLKFWSLNYDSFESSLDELGSLLSRRTKIVAVAHVSNLLGEVLDLEKVVRYVKERVDSRKVRIVADGVAYAPHRAVDVAKWGVDWYVFSAYKVYGPHMAVLFGTKEAFMDVRDVTPNFDFVSCELSKKFELGSVCHESCAGILALGNYMKFLANSGRSYSSEDLESMAEAHEESKSKVRQQNNILSSQVQLQSVSNAWRSTDRGVIESAFHVATQLEQPLQTLLISYLKSKENVIIFGPRHANSETRVPTISFVHKHKSSSEVCQKIQKAGFAIRNGHMYAPRLVASWIGKHNFQVNRKVEDGVVRISMVHYNTPTEVAQLIDCIDNIL